ncbi:MAG: DUF4386 family protein [Rhizobiales bacterium]|nr:DUF4386 domain-containing protein [Hyphomicrobiales bacterium]NRB13233.1 DUF4386 family protein [Hyphomicrobiales bacterium]
MKNIAKIGGIAALIDAATYLFGMVILIAYLTPPDYGNNDADMLQKVGFLVDNSTLLYIFNFVIYVVNAIFLAILAVALYKRLEIKTPALAQLSLTIGGIWATLVLGAGMVANVGFAEVLLLYETDKQAATSLWHILNTIENGLGGGNEIAGGVWAIVLGMGFLASKCFSKPLGYFSLIIGAAGLSTIFPPFSEIGGAIFGLGFILWFVWVGVALLRPAKDDQFQTQG